MMPHQPGRPDPKVRPGLPHQPMFHRHFRADHDKVRSVLTDIRKRFSEDINDDTMGRLELVLAEVMNNVAEHGSERALRSEQPSIHLCIVRHDSGLSCAVTDDGVSLPADCLLPRSLPDHGEILPEGGFGWYLIQDLTQALCYYREERRNFLAFSIPFSTEAA